MTWWYTCSGKKATLWCFSPSTFMWGPGFRLSGFHRNCLYLLSHSKAFMCILLFVFLALFSLLSPPCNKNSDQKQLKGGKVYFSLRLQVQSIAEGQEAWLLGHISLPPAKKLCFIARSTYSWTHDGCCLLGGLQAGLHSATFLRQFRSTCGISHSGVGSVMLLIIHPVPTDIPTGQSQLAIS